MFCSALENGAKVREKVVAMAWNVNLVGPKKSQIQFLSNIRKSKANLNVSINTRLQGNLDDCFRKLGGGWAFFNSYITNSRGIAVLLKDDFEVEEIIFENVIPGNLSRMTFMLQGERYLINCLYASNEDLTNENYKKFFKKLFADSD